MQAMDLYRGMSVDFISDAIQNKLASAMEQVFFEHYRFKPGPSEVRSWQQSLRSMATALQTGGFVDHGEQAFGEPQPLAPAVEAGLAESTFLG